MFTILGILIIIFDIFCPLFLTPIGVFLIGYDILFALFQNIYISILGGTFLGLLLIIFLKNLQSPLIDTLSLIGKEGKVVKVDGNIWVEVDNEVWLAKSEDKLKKGDNIKVEKVDGVTLIVKKI